MIKVEFYILYSHRVGSDPKFNFLNKTAVLIAKNRFGSHKYAFWGSIMLCLCSTLITVFDDNINQCVPDHNLPT